MPKFVGHRRTKSVIRNKNKRKSIFDMPDSVLLTPVKVKLQENIYTAEEPLMVKVVSNTKMENDSCHIVLEHEGKFKFVEG